MLSRWFSVYPGPKLSSINTFHIFFCSSSNDHTMPLSFDAIQAHTFQFSLHSECKTFLLFYDRVCIFFGSKFNSQGPIFMGSVHFFIEVFCSISWSMVMSWFHGAWLCHDFMEHGDLMISPLIGQVTYLTCFWKDYSVSRLIFLNS